MVTTSYWLLFAFLSLNLFIALIFWLHERIENNKATILKDAVEKAVRAVEQACALLDNPAKKQEAVLRVEALLGIYKWLIPSLVIDTAIEAEVYLIRHMHKALSVDHDTPEEVTRGEGSS